MQPLAPSPPPAELNLQVPLMHLSPASGEPPQLPRPQGSGEHARKDSPLPCICLGTVGCVFSAQMLFLQRDRARVEDAFPPLRLSGHRVIALYGSSSRLLVHMAQPRERLADGGCMSWALPSAWSLLPVQSLGPDALIFPNME